MFLVSIFVIIFLLMCPKTWTFSLETKVLDWNRGSLPSDNSSNQDVVAVRAD
jgi:hypothetical protein